MASPRHARIPITTDRSDTIDRSARRDDWSRPIGGTLESPVVLSSTGGVSTFVNTPGVADGVASWLVERMMIALTVEPESKSPEVETPEPPRPGGADLSKLEDRAPEWAKVSRSTAGL